VYPQRVSLVSLLFLIPAAHYLMRARRAYGHERRGRCRHCGYDLRASTDRCPECGTPIPPRARPTDPKTG
jgi:hypothetical protein